MGDLMDEFKLKSLLDDLLTPILDELRELNRTMSGILGALDSAENHLISIDTNLESIDNKLFDIKDKIENSE
jgi:hypothetical protein